MSLRRILLVFLAGYVVAYLTIPLLALVVHAQDYLVATVTSFHFDRSKDYNESNFGLGIERRYSDEWAGSVGYFKNSFYRNTVYVFAGYTPYRYGEWRYGVVVGAVTGYENNVSPWITGVATRDYGRFGVNIVLAASAMALQVKVKWK